MPTPPRTPGDGIQAIAMRCVDAKATYYGTFQSHNQKVIHTPGGLFMTYLRSRNEEYTAQQWRLMHSADGGETWRVLHEETNATNPPVLEADEAGTVYLIRPDFVDDHSYLYRFAAGDLEAPPVISVTPHSMAGKFCALFDAGRRELHYFSHNKDSLFTLDLEGHLLRTCRLTTAGANAITQYPHLCLDAAGTLYAAWTTSYHDRYLYWDIHVAKSPDGGVHWHKLDGTPLELPVVADDASTADRISLDDELEVHTWLHSFVAKGGKLHFAYRANTDPPRFHYMRYDLATGARDMDLTPRFGGETLEATWFDGFFAAAAEQPESPLYYVGANGSQLVCLVSHDNGATWHDHAVSRSPIVEPYAIGGCRELTPEGDVIGSFTDRGVDPAHVHFIRIPGARRRDG